MHIFTKNILSIFLLIAAFGALSWASPLTEAMKSSIEGKLDQALEGKNDVFSVFNETPPLKTISWNENVWTHDLDLTGVAWWNSADGYYRRATLITPRHLVIATHYSLSVGNEVAFLQKDNTLVYRTITAKRTLELPSNIPDDILKSVDIDILELESDVPSGINYYPIFNIDDLKIRIDDTFPVISLNQDNKPSILPVTYSDDPAKSNLKNTYKGKLITAGEYDDFTEDEKPFNTFRQEDLRKGDSSNPIFALLGNQLVLFSHHSRTASSTNFSWFVDAIDAELAVMGTNYRVTVADVSRFPTLDGDIVPSVKLDSAPEVTEDTFLIQKNKNQTKTVVAQTSVKNVCSPSQEYIACQSRYNTFAGAKKTLSCLGVIPEKYTGYSAETVKRSATLSMALKMLRKDMIKPSKKVKIYRDVTKDLSLLQMTQTGISYGLLSETNNYFRPNRNTTRAEAYHMFVQSVCLPVEKQYPEWEKNLYTTAYAQKFTTVPWEKFEADRYLTNGELLLIAKRVLEYKYTYGGCESEKKSCDIR